VTFCTNSRIKPEDLPARIRDNANSPDAMADFPIPARGPDNRFPTLAEVEKQYIAHVLEKVGGNKKRAADILGVARRTLYRRLG
jgi:DNA-binding NtrC family response regulator